MEGAKARKSVVIGLMLLVLSNVIVEKSEAKFSVGCYITCLALCVPFKNPLLCGADCGIKCLITSPLDVSTSKVDDPHQFCHLGCAISTCSGLITKDNSGTVKAEKCANSCGTKCSKNYSSP